MHKRVLVTGGAGFIGSHLCEKLLEMGYDIVCMDNYFTGHKDNIRHLLGHPNFEFIEHDIRRPFSIQVDEIYNLACPAAPIHYQRDPIKTLQTSILGINNILELASQIKRKNHKSVRVLQASTSEIYGDPIQHPQKEEHWGNVNSLGIRACYNEGKRAAESLMMDFYRERKVDIRIARIFNTYGPRIALNDGRVISNFIIQALKNKPITIYGDGNQTRSFCYVSDLVRGLIVLMEQDEFIGPVNLGNPSEFTINKLAEKILKITGSDSKIEYHKLPEDDPKQRSPDITLARQKLNWEPHINIELGLQNTIPYFKAKMNSTETNYITDFNNNKFIGHQTQNR